MECRPSCGACCIAPSISSPLPGMPKGKPVGVRCVHLDDALRCALFGRPERPAVCGDFGADRAVCGETRAEALVRLSELEAMTV